tara:strand:- start:812 stop:985 length:174 start_codon:yes stop_codon:yes gene_type:complete
MLNLNYIKEELEKKYEMLQEANYFIKLLEEKDYENDAKRAQIEEDLNMILKELGMGE